MWGCKDVGVWGDGGCENVEGCGGMWGSVGGWGCWDAGCGGMGMWDVGVWGGRMWDVGFWGCGVLGPWHRAVPSLCSPLSMVLRGDGGSWWSAGTDFRSEPSTSGHSPPPLPVIAPTPTSGPALPPPVSSLNRRSPVRIPILRPGPSTSSQTTPIPVRTSQFPVRSPRFRPEPPSCQLEYLLLIRTPNFLHKL